MPHLRFLYDNKWGATIGFITASSEVSALPVSASQNPDRSYVARSAVGTGTWTIDRDLGSVLPVSAVALANVKTIGDGVVELYHRGDSTSPGAAVLVATLPAQNRDTRTTFAFFTSASHRHWQLKFTNPTMVNDYSELGFAFLGVPYEPTINVRVPADVQRPDPSVGVASLDGQETFAIRQKYFTGAWEFLEVQDTQRDDLATLWDTLGTTSPMFMVLDANRGWTSWYARLTDALGITFGVLDGRYTVRFPWREVR